MHVYMRMSKSGWAVKWLESDVYVTNLLGEMEEKWRLWEEHSL